MAKHFERVRSKDPTSIPAWVPPSLHLAPNSEKDKNDDAPQSQFQFHFLLPEYPPNPRPLAAYPSQPTSATANANVNTRSLPKVANPYYRLDPTHTLSRVLRDKSFLEFPTIELFVADEGLLIFGEFEDHGDDDDNDNGDHGGADDGDGEEENGARKRRKLDMRPVTMRPVATAPPLRPQGPKKLTNLLGDYGSDEDGEDAEREGHDDNAAAAATADEEEDGVLDMLGGYESDATPPFVRSSDDEDDENDDEDGSNQQKAESSEVSPSEPIVVSYSVPDLNENDDELDWGEGDL